MTRSLSTAIALALFAALVAPAAWAGTRTYKGKNFDPVTAKSVGRYTIKAKTARKDGEKRLKVRVSCKPRRKCSVFRRKKFKLFPGVDPFEYQGTFGLGGATCTVSGYVYASGFETTFDCDDGRFGSITGRR
jgi:hypothetical protein